MVPFLAPLLALIAGILVSPCLAPEPVWLCLPLAALVAVARPRCAFLPVLLLGGGLRSLEPAVPPDPGNDTVRLTGRLLRRPEWRGLGVYLDVQLTSIDMRPYRGRARLTEFLDNPELLQLFNALELGTGDRLEIVVRLHRPVTYRNPGVFDFRRHLERQGIYWSGTIRNPRLITVLERGWHGTDRIRDWVEARLDRRFESDRTVQGLVVGMVLGRKHGLTAETERQFQAGGLYHLVVVSGFNLAVVASAAAWIVRFLARKRLTRLLLVFLCVVAYSLVAGGQTPVMRAALMASILIASKALDRGYSSLNAAALTAFLILIADPTALEDPSFQMTFAAVLAVIGAGLPTAKWVFQRLDSQLRHFNNVSRDGHLPPVVADWRVARRMWCELHHVPYAAITTPLRFGQLAGEALIISVWIELAMACFMVESFHRLSPISPLLNVPAGFIAAAITPLGLVLILLPDILAPAPIWLIRQLVAALLWVLSVALNLPHASFRVPSAPLWLWGLYAIAMSIAVVAVHRRKSALCLAGLASLVGFQSLMIIGDFSPVPPKDVVLTFLDVGQGDSTLVEFPDGRRMLVDGGGVSAGRFLGLRDESTFSIGEDVVSTYLFSRRIRRLDIVVLSHAHHDHLDGLHDVIANFQIGELWLGRNPMVPAYRALLEQAQQRQIPIRWVYAGQTYGNVEILHPPQTWRVRQTAQNNDSIVLLLRTADRTALLTGDLEASIPAPNHVNVLKVPHHGSGATRLRVRSDIRVISVGATNPFGHPHPSSLPGLRTDQMGAIEVRLTGARPQVSSPLTDPCQSCNVSLLLPGH